MAQYTQKIYAADSYSINAFGDIVRGNSITAKVNFDFWGGTDYSTTGYKDIKVIFPTDYIRMDKKREIAKEIFTYVERKSFSREVYVIMGGTASKDRFPNSGDFTCGASPYDWVPREFVMNFSHEVNYNDVPLNTYTNRLREAHYSNELLITAEIGCNVGYLYTNRRYVANCEYTISSHTGTNPPYMKLTLEDVIPFASNRLPIKFIDKKLANTFSWKFDYSNYGISGVIKQASSKFRYRTKGETTYTEVLIEGETNTHTLPANMLTADEIEWQVIVTSDDNIESTQSDWVTVTTVDSIPTCQVIYPNDTFIDGTQDNLFTWSHIIDTGSPQTKYDLQYSTDGTGWVDLSTEATPRESYHVIADTLPAGSIKWRVRTYNTDNVAGGWSTPGSIVIRSAPPMPSIVSINSKSRPTIQWGSVGQEAFRLTVFQESKTIYETGIVGSNKKQFKLPIYLEDGNYKFELSIINVYGLESKPLIGSLDVLTTKPGVAQLTMKPLENAVKLFIRLNPLATKAYILRNAIPIKKITSQAEWIDYNASGSNSYVIRSVDANDNFSDSELLWADTDIKRAVIAPVADTSYILELKVRRDNPITKRGAVDLTGTPKHFAGREYPVFVFSQTTNETKELFYTFRSQAEFDKFKHIVSLRKTILYRDYQNEVFYGVVTSYEFDKDKYGIDVSFQMTKVDYREEISYDIWGEFEK